MVVCIPVFEYLEENTYFYIDDHTKHGFLIDPGAEANKLLDLIKKHHWVIEKILLTHGHFDHMGAVEKIKKELHIHAYSYSDFYLKNPNYNLSHFYRNDLILNDTKRFQEGDLLKLEEGDLSLKVIHTPGHTEDSCIFYSEEHLAFVGDTIFKDSYGNPNFPGGNINTLFDSIRNKILTLPDDTKLYSGHTEVTTVKEEKEHY